MIRPVSVSPSYRASVAMATLAMLAAPVVYAAFVGLIAIIVYFWAVGGALWMGRGFTLWIYLALLGAGLTVLFFLCKPFFTAPRIDRTGTVISLTDHPRLGSLVSRVCAATGAPEPVEVMADMSLNASASLVHPFWGLFNNRYRLTIGLPLTAISDQQHMAHVIAHEVGHFSQSGAMRVRQLIHWSEYYLSQLVNGRDKWDVWLASKTDGTAYIVRLFAWAAMGGIWLSRAVLRLLLRGTLLVNARMSREMEFHADVYAIRVAGSKAFEQSVETFAAGSAAISRAMHMAHRSGADRQYPADMAGLTRACYLELTSEQRHELARQGRYTIGVGYDSHPDDAERLERSERENDPGLLIEHGDGAELFEDFPTLCEKESRRFFEVTNEELLSTQALMDEDRLRDTRDAARIDYFGVVYDGPVWLHLQATPPPAGADPASLIAAGDEARSATLPFFQEIVGAYSKWVLDAAVLRRLDGGLPVDWMQYEMEPCDAEEARRRMFAREKEFARHVEEFHRATTPIQARLLAAWARRDELPAEKAALFDRLVNGIRGLEAADTITTQVAIDLAVLSEMGPLIDENIRHSRFMQMLQSEFEAALRHGTVFESALAELQQPLTGSGSLLDYARPVPMAPDGGVYGYLQVYGGMLGRVRDVRLRMMGLLAELATEVEAK